MFGYGQCEQCKWVPMRQHTSVRPPPWTGPDVAVQFHVCEKCGSITAQRTDSSDGVGVVWMLPPDAMAFFRTDTPPNSVISYVLSESFEDNKAIAKPLFRGYLGFVRDLSVHANSIIAALEKHRGEASRTRVLIELLADVLDEAIRRFVPGESGAVRCRVRRVGAVIDEVVSANHYGDVPADERAELRFAALQTLERFCHPALWESLPRDEAMRVEKVVDHLSLLQRSRETLEGALRLSGSDGAEVIAAEAKFLYRLFRRRTARLSDPDSEMIWRCMRQLEGRVDPARARSDMPTVAYERLRRLLEHQLMEFGVLKQQTDETGRVIFQEPRSGLILQLPRFAPHVEIFASARAGSPERVIDRWSDVLELIRWHAGPASR